MAEEPPKASQEQPKDKGFWGSLSLAQKIILGLLILGFVVIGFVFLFGGINSIWEFAFVIFLSIGLFIIAYIVIWAAKMFYAEKYYSPKEDYFTRLTNMAIDFCPKNLNNLYFEGSINKASVLGGKIVGCIGIPYFVGEQELTPDGNPIFMESKLLRTQVPRFKKITFGEDGDTLFIIEKGWFIFKKKHYIRCNRQLHGDLNGDVVIFDINPVPYGKFFEYPFKQLQQQAGQIMIQSQLETVLATHEHQGDLISQAADAGLYFNPYMRLVENTKAEIAREG